MIIRDAEISDAKALLEIYAPYVTDTAVSFEYTVPSIEEFSRRIAAAKLKYPYLAAESGGEIMGYCYAGQFHAREAYDRSVEVSIYVRQDARRRGIGGKLYEVLEKRLYTQGITNLYACIAYPRGEDEYLTADSVYFHEHMGYKKCGHFSRCGIKFGHEYDMIYMEKNIG